jgi:hypothetical protein
METTGNCLPVKVGIFAVTLILLVSGCQNRPSGDSGAIRFESILRETPSDRIRDTLGKINSDLLTFLRIFNEGIIRIGPDTSASYTENMDKYLSDPGIKGIYARLEQSNPQINIHLRIAEDALDRIPVVVPALGKPLLVTYIGGFNQSFAAMPGVLAIGLENYLGDTCSIYQGLGIPAYLRARMKPENLAADAVRAWVYSGLEPLEPEAGFLDHMVYQGKAYWLLKTLMPGLSDAELFQYSPEQAGWCKENEKAMWRYLAEKEVLFTSDRLTIRRFFEEAPFTREFGNDSPGRTGAWIGYRMVSRYMKSTGVKPEELLKESNSRKILSLSKYHP